MATETLPLCPDPGPPNRFEFDDGRTISIGLYLADTAAVLGAMARGFGWIGG